MKDGLRKLTIQHLASCPGSVITSESQSADRKLKAKRRDRKIAAEKARVTKILDSEAEGCDGLGLKRLYQMGLYFVLEGRQRTGPGYL